MKKEEVLKFYSKYKMLIFPTIIALSTLFLIAFVILPQTIKLVTNQKTGSDLLTKSQFLEVKAQTLDSLNEEDLSRKLQHILNVYPPDRDFGNVLGIIQTLTGKVGFSIESFNVGGSPGKAGAQSYNIILQLAGPRELIPAMLNAFENAPRLMKVESIEISQPAGVGGGKVNLGLDVLFSPLPQNLGTVDSPLPQLSQKEEELLVRLASVQEEAGIISSGGEVVSTSPRGKANPFE